MCGDSEFYSNPKVVRFFVICLAFCFLFVVIFTSYEIHLYSKEPVAITGKLLKLDYNRGGPILYVNGENYYVYKSRHNRDTFGIFMNLKGTELLPLLEEKLGSEANIEYIETRPGRKQIVSLTIDEWKVVDRIGAVRDNIKEAKTDRIIGIMLLAAYLAIVLRVRSAVKD